MPNGSDRVLVVVNDQKIARQLINDALRPAGFTVSLQAGVSEALNAIQRFGPDVILADLDLPGMSAKDLMIALAAQGRGDIPVIVLGRADMQSGILQAFRTGAYDFLVWPVQETEVIASLERALKHVRVRRERAELARQVEQTNHALAQRLRELETLSAVGKDLLSINDPRRLLERLIKTALDLTHADAAWLVTRQERTGALVLSAQRGLPARLQANIGKAWEDGAGTLVAVSGETLAIHGQPLQRYPLGKLGKSALVAPIKAGKQVIGLLNAIRKEEHPFTPEQQRLIEAVADYAAIALVNQRLFQAVEERAAVVQRNARYAVIDARLRAEWLDSELPLLTTPLKTAQANLDKLRGTPFVQQDINLAALEELQTALQQIEWVLATRGQTGAALTSAPSLLDLADLTRQALEPYKALAARRQIDLQVEMPSDPILVLAHKLPMRLAIQGLLARAIAYSVPDTQQPVGVEVRQDQRAILSITDQGVGYPDTSEKSTSAGRRATASLGIDAGPLISLALLRQIVETYHGELHLESRPGKGTVAVISMPLSSAL